MAKRQPAEPSVKSLVDNLAQVYAEMASLQEIADGIEANLKARGSGRYDGSLLTAVVYKRSAVYVNWKEIAAKLGFQLTNSTHKRWLKQLTKRTPCLVVKLTRRKTTKGTV